MEVNEKKKLLDDVIEIVNKVSRLLVEGIDDQKTVIKNLKRDVKLQADYESNKFIISELSGFSNFKILSEETEEWSFPLDDDELYWIVDPLDGSVNYSRSIPLFCISIALWKGNNPVIGVIYDFIRNELFSGIVGIGAWLGAERMNVSNISEMNNAVVCTGFPVKSDFSNEVIYDFITKIQRFKKVRLLGSAALSLAYVASGRVDYYHENNIAIWDVAAGIALVVAAGGKTAYETGNENNRLIVRATNQKLQL